MEKQSVAASASERKLSYAEQKEMSKIVRKAEKEVTDAEKAIEEIEGRIADMETRLANGDASAELLSDYAAMQKKLENQMSVWELAQQRLDELKG